MLQLAPIHPSVQLHVQLLLPSMHVPPLRHVTFSQLSTAEKKKTKENPWYIPHEIYQTSYET